MWFFAPRSRALALAVTVLFAAPAAGKAAEPWAGVPVFMYHRIDPAAPVEAARQLTLTPAQFETELRGVQKAGFRSITATELAAALKRGEHPTKTVVFTFDDGYDDQIDYAVPLLRKYGFRATFYVIRNTIGTPKHFTWKQIRALSAQGMEIGAHGMDHVDLSEYDRSGQLAQARGCAAALRRFAGISATTYAYPAGDYNATTLGVMREVGMQVAFTTASGLVRSLERPYELPRIRVNREGAETAVAPYLTNR